MSKATPPKQSRYLPIWNKLKTEKLCRITAPAIYHKTIVKMIKNRRDKDLGYKLECAEKRTHEQIQWSVEGTVITFKLIRKLRPRDL